MNNEVYIAALKRALANMDKESREEILREIQSHMEDAQDIESLEARFGPVEELARQYLDGEPVRKKSGERIARLGKKALAGIGGAVLAILLLVTALVWIYSGDRFDYADETALASEVTPADWKVREWPGPVALEVDQAHAVLYWHEKPELRWHCKGRDELDPTPGNALRIRHGYCLIYLPLQTTSLKVSQSDVVMVRPRASVDAGINQASLRIAPNGGSYRYNFRLTHSEAADFLSDPEASTVVAVKANESSVMLYESR